MSVYYEGSCIKVWAKMLKNGQKINADDATKADGPFCCLDSPDELIIRKCTEKINHFAYSGRISPTGNIESSLHFDCKTEICNSLKIAFPNGNWEVERELSEDKHKEYKKVRPDISGRFGSSKADQAIIIEVQASTLSIKTILKRSEEYTKRKAFLLWILPLENELGSKIFRPRLFERFLHSMYFGRVYYWQRGNGTLVTPTHFGNAQKYIELNSWYETGGVERSEGDYYKDYKRLKKPIYGSHIDLLSDFETNKRSKFKVEENELKNIPECNIFKDKLKVWWSDKPTKYRKISLESSDLEECIDEVIEEKV